ncbi:MAG: thioredoxin [Sphingobium sp.]|uniref:thioredoxin n=1 Tax=Sphingobium sp. TaxID=1912891 RepID=UPI000DB2E6ED|nr:thioredoxin [Sphingobium sp.]PZU06941.1 MAG: thioredoxin [Sphingobium sp.]
MSGITTVTDDNFDDYIRKSTEPVLVDFWAAWCGPCKALAPTLDGLAQDYHGVVSIAKMDVDANQATRDRLDVRGIPMLALFVDGQEIARLTGIQSKAKLSSFLDGHLDRTPSEQPSAAVPAIPTSAFLGDPAVKALCLERLHRHIAAETALPGFTTWDGANGSPLGCATECASADDAAAATGIPASLIELADMLATYYGSAAAGSTCVAEWLDAVPVGADCSGLPVEMIVALLQTAEVREAVDTDPALSALLAEIVALHREAPDRADAGRWAKLRQRVTELVKSGDGVEGALRECLESATWPLSNGDVLRDVLNNGSMIPTARATSSAGWTNEDERNASTQLNEIAKEMIGAGREPSDAADEFIRRNPELGNRWMAAVTAQQDAMIAFGQAVGCLLLERTRALAAQGTKPSFG